MFLTRARFSILVLLLIAAAPHILWADPTAVYQNPTAPLEARVDDLFSKLTQAEKLSMLTGTTFTSEPLPKLSLPGMQFADAGQGVRGGGGPNDPVAGPATAFPAGVSMASSWDLELEREIGKAIGEEARNKGTGVQIELGPAVNIHRSPLCGRDSEYMSEDPYFNARMAVQYIEGMQSTGTLACIKHYACNNEEVDRGDVNVIVDERALREIYLPAFEAAVKEAHVGSIMAAYNKVNGPWCTANWYLLTNVLRNEWGWDGLVMSDWGATHAIGPVVTAGTDLEMPGPGLLSASNLQRGLDDGSIPQSSIDHAVKDILRATIRAGLADPVQHVPDHSVVGSPEHQALALRAGEEGMVLLRNEGGILPLDPTRKQTIALIGPRVKNWQYNSWGSTGLQPTVQIDAFDGITQRLAANTKTTILYDPADNTGEDIPTVDLLNEDGSAHGLTGEYYRNMDLTGHPLATRTDTNINFPNLLASAQNAGIGATDFSIRWTGTLTAPSTGRYTFIVSADDGCLLFINGTPIIDHWVDGAAYPEFGGIDMAAGQKYPIKLEYYQNAGAASIQLAWLTPSKTGNAFQSAVSIAKRADVAIVMVGGEGEEEGTDRSSMSLTAGGDELVREIAAANPHTVVVLNNGGPILVHKWIESVPAVLEAGFPGELGGKALAAVLFGDFDPSGKLVDTYGMRREDYPDYGNFPGVKNVVHYSEGIYVGYRAFDKRQITPEFPFGYGLSYTKFKYSNILLPVHTWNPAGHLTVTADITNVGSREGAEVAELYIEPKAPKIDRPIRELKGFDRVELAQGETKTASFTLTPRDFAYFDVPGKQWRADAGEYAVEIGASSRDLLLTAPLQLADTWTDPVPGVGAKDPFAPPPSLSGGKLATASSEKAGNLASYAFDGDLSTRWESDWSDPQWIEVDLGKPTTFSKARLSWETAYGKAYELQSSDDNVAWATDYSTTDGQGGDEKLTFPAVTARYVRLFITQRGTGFGDSLYSFDLYP